MSCCGPHVSLRKTRLVLVKQCTGACSCVQCFFGGTINYNIRKFTADDLTRTGEWLSCNKKKLYVHAPYVINLAHSSNQEMVEKGAESLQNILTTLKRTGAAEQTGCVLHIGANGTIANVVRELNDLNICAPLYLENCAGEGSKLGRNVDELRALLEGCDSRNVGLCIDTCHSYGAGMTDMRSATKIVQTFDELDCDRMAIHLNDSLEPFRSKKDRHAVLGEGLIWSACNGEDATDALFALRDYAFDRSWDIILETPSADLHELDILLDY